MSRRWHKLISRQLRRSGLPNPDEVPLEWQAFLNKVNNTYIDTDEARELISHSIEVSSEEMSELHAKLEAYNDELEEEVKLRTQELRKANNYSVL